MNFQHNEFTNIYPHDIFQFSRQLQIPLNNYLQNDHNCSLIEIKNGINLNLSFPIIPYYFESIVNPPLNPFFENGINGDYYSMSMNPSIFNPLQINSLINSNRDKSPPISLLVDHISKQNPEKIEQSKNKLGEMDNLHSRRSDGNLICMPKNSVEEQSINYHNVKKGSVNISQKHSRKELNQAFYFSEKLNNQKGAVDIRKRTANRDKLKTLLNKRKKLDNHMFMNTFTKKKCYSEFKNISENNEQLLAQNDKNLIMNMNMKEGNEKNENRNIHGEQQLDVSMNQEDNSETNKEQIIYLPKLMNRRKFSNKIWRVNGKFITKEEATKLLNIPSEYFMSSKKLQEIFQSFLNFTISASINGLTFNNFSDMLLFDLSSKEKINISSPFKFEIKLLMIDYKKKIIHLQIDPQIHNSKEVSFNLPNSISNKKEGF